ncbi:hypothetical protein ONZ43_g6671 [Nemania bipapillata]|uniref:Uncharacterized protein n=1 Tax=Nemania bipapillata TaxID=110536 RepID=A0ACC2HX22_9PEZI|nr:hypothetical protein ONZ43_g6671 [Nemania bipapillata]
MQTLWSRAVQAQSSCRCRICLTPTNALIRRSASAAPLRRKVTVADIFTACYTTILGTAALIDARRKNERRQALDGELDRARASLKQLGVQEPWSSRGGENGDLDGGTLAPRKLPTWRERPPDNKEIVSLLEELKSTHNLTSRPFAHRLWIQDQIDWADIEAAIVLEEEDATYVPAHTQVTDYKISHT